VLCLAFHPAAFSGVSKLMSKRLVLVMPLFLSFSGHFSTCAFGQSSRPDLGIGVNVSSLGAGIQGAVSVTSRSDIRAGFNFFNFDHGFVKDGIDYSGQLKLRSAQVTYDQFLIGGFHISPGVLIYDGNRVTASASVPAGQSFTLGGASFYSSQANPVSGSGSLSAGKVAPMILLGFGNLLPRSERHFGINFEFGVVYQGSPRAKLNLAGSSCLVNPASGCVNTATDPFVQTSLLSEQTKLNNDLIPFKFYPVVSLGFSYKF
jgi:hypothetical protein